MTDVFEFNVDPKLKPTIERKLTGTTTSDVLISQLGTRTLPMSVRLSVSILRLYRLVTPRRIRNRCVFEPSCSHYSELAIRQHGVKTGLYLSASRLKRCNANSGGIDFKGLNKEILCNIK